MIEFAGYALLRPWWLLALPAVALVTWLAWRRSEASSGWEQAVDPALMAAFSRMGRVIEGKARRNFLPAIAMFLVVLALAGPSHERRDTESFRNLDGVVLVMDVSDSVTKGPAWADAMTAARIVAQSAGSKQVALIVFAGDAYLASPLTTDARVLGTTISFLTEGIVPDSGSRPARGLLIADQVLAESEIVAGDVVLISDGAGLDAESSALASAIRSRGARLSTVSVPSGGLDARPGDPAAMSALASVGGGVTVQARNPSELANLLGSGLAKRLETTGYAVLAWQDFGRYLLLFAMIPVLMMFRRVA
jgi:Ca-activated chloride channel family protein